MTAAELRARLAAVPDVELAESAEVLRLVDEQAAALDSAAALASVATDPYWPKWASPWWSMLLLVELGFSDRIPPRIARVLVRALNAMPLHTFPIHEDEWPAGVDRKRQASCHCALGNIDRVLDACGVDVDRELPWIAAWFARYQMADGGYNCDESAYLVEGEAPSSMVGTIAIVEALTRRGPSELCDRATGMLIARELRHGSPTVHNAEEREAAKAWGTPAFPRFYFYDVLRGASALVGWAASHGRELPLAAIAPAVEHLLALAPDGIVRVGRRPDAGLTTIEGSGDHTRRPADSSPLIEAVGQIGAPSPALTRAWTATRATLRALVDAGRVT